MMIDYFSKWAEAYALPNHNAETDADCIVNCPSWDPDKDT